MSTKHSIDFSGARGSNTGDQFHEFWALQQVLDLLNPKTDLKAVGVEGVRTELPSQNADDPTWDGVDCALYYGGTRLETADRIEFAQLKYSAANPETLWSVARLSTNTAKKGNNSVIRKMADDFKAAKVLMKQGAPLQIRLVSNQALSAELKKALDTRWSGSFDSAGIDEPTANSLKRLNDASGLTATEFQDFLETLDFSECGSGSRFAVREKVVAAVADLLGNDVSSEVRDLQVRVRELMLPERAREIVTEKNVLLWFGLSSREGLFPCPPDVRIPERTVERAASDEAIRLLTRGERVVLVHGIGGCGKTILMRQIADRLPDQSVTVFFDCFGGGRYIHSDDKRHLPENAFLHLANELAVTLRLPLFIPRNNKYPATIKSFLAKLRSAGEALSQFAQGSMLLIVVDAADNAIAAADAAVPPECPFVFDLFEANLTGLPENIRIIASCRTAHIASLRLPLHTPEVICPPFTAQESRQHLDISFPSPSSALVEQFHGLSKANPRVQAYAIAAANGDQDRLLEALLPGGKSLNDVLKVSFDTALQKLGKPQIFFQKLIGTLAFLPAPISVSTMARITGCNEDAVKDLALDLQPGLRLDGSAISVADEDFEAFIKEMGSPNRDAIGAAIAQDFFTTFQTDPYSAIHVADKLIAAGRARDLLSVIEGDPLVSAIDDPIVRRQVQIRRLKLSLSACREMDSSADALRIVLISAEAERDDSALNKVLEEELDLSVEFAGSSLRRTILLDAGRVEEHGSFLAQDAVRAIRTGDRVTAREQLYFHEAWLERRRQIAKEDLSRWTVADRDIAARVETILELAGPIKAVDELRRWKPRDVSLRVCFILVPQLIAAGKVSCIKQILKECPPSGPWDLLLRVPLAMAGESVNGLAIERSIRRIRRCFIPDAGAFRVSPDSDWWKEHLLDTFITACELAFKLGLDSQTILLTVTRVLEVLEGKGKEKRHLFGSDVIRFDGLLRCWLLEATVTGKAAKDEDFIAYLNTLDPEPQPEKSRDSKRQRKRTVTHHTDKQEVEKRNRKIRALFPVYSARLEILSCAGKNHKISDEQLNKLGSVASHAYDFDYDYYSSNLRDIVAKSVMGLLIVENIVVSELLERAGTLVKGRFGDRFASHRRNLWNRVLFRAAEADTLVRLAAQAVTDIKGLRAASSEKLEAIIQLSRLILPVSGDDAKSLFNEAVSIAKEIDQEAFDQIDFVSVLSERARIQEHNDRRTIAAEMNAFVSGAAMRLADHEGFPWKSATRALTCVDDTTALAAISRWADEGTVSLYHTLDRFLLTALQRDIIGPEVATSLAVLIEGSDGELRKELIARAAAAPEKYKEIIEELAKETLLFSPQDARLSSGQEIVDRISPRGCLEGSWLARLRDTVAFLRQITDNKPEEAATIGADNAPRLAKDNDFPKEFELNTEGRSFTTAESIAEVLETAKKSGLIHNDRYLLGKMRDVSSGPRDRVPFLNALVEIPKGFIWGTYRIEMIRDTVDAWKGIPAVADWCKEVLPSVLVTHFDFAVRWLKEGQSVMHQLLDYTGCNAEGRLRIVLAGVAQAGESLSSRTLFAIAEEIARTLDAEASGAQLAWYVHRLRSRLPAEDQALCALGEIPSDETEAISRFLFALMSDIDTRIRWKAAHALRRLAKLRCFDIVKATVLQSNRAKDDAFRDPTGPFYFLASKLWLAISLYRISAETPEALSSLKAEIFDLATSSELLHVGVREYTKRALLQLASAGAISLTSSEQVQLARVNTAIKGQTTKKKDHHRSFGLERDEKRRFKFDYMDTIPYWYEDILRIFPTVSQDQVLEIAERWILDKWGAAPDTNWWDKEPRKARYEERRYGLWSHRQGSLPMIERYGTHLEWNAMYCVVGELLTTHPISKGNEYSFGSFDYWLGRVLPTEPPAWLSDNRGPTPLEPRLWNEDPRTDSGWLHNVRRDEFLAEVGICAPLREGWIVIEGHYTAYFPKREANIRISSALVSPKTATALVRALQTVSNPWDFGIPDEDSDLQIDEPPYQLLGWLTHVESDHRFDERDPLRYEVGRAKVKPGHKVTRSFGLVPQAGIHRAWICNQTGKRVFIYEAWCDEPPPRDDYYPRRIRSDGWRLWAKADIVRSFLINGARDLICEVQVERRLRSGYGWSYEDTKRKTHDKILLLRANGSVDDAKGCVGSWAGIG
ncbi:MAG: hypothetical protein NTV58_17065 [Deltaproteobacteria bacterium]|nr:hypothetical protein [Deltaproteobacteria bacterium]